MDRVKMVVKAKGVEDIILGDKKDTQDGKNIKGLKLELFVPDNVINNSSKKMLAMITVEGVYTQKEHGSPVAMKQMFDWSRDDSSAANYRDVELDIFDQDAEKPNRHFKFPDMFVLSYSETYGKWRNEETVIADIQFRLVLRQSDNGVKLKAIVNDLK